MRTTRHPSSDRLNKAAMFIDYNSLFEAVEGRVGKRTYPDEVILEMVAELQRHVARDFGCEIGLCHAYADFSLLGDHAGHIQRELAHNGIEPRFTPSTIQTNASENILNFEVGRLVGSESDETTIVILTGNRVYHVLANALAQLGKHVIVMPVGMDGEVSDRDVHGLVRYVSASLLLSDAVKKATGDETGTDELGETETAEVGASRGEVVYSEVVDDAGSRTLEVVEKYFGQYDEVYLTPLLRKLTEEFGDLDYDPKTVINALEEAGAVWLEKRRGFPYDYTVLLIDGKHPSVAAIRASASRDTSHNSSEEVSLSDTDDYVPLSETDDGTSAVEEDIV